MMGQLQRKPITLSLVFLCSNCVRALREHLKSLGNTPTLLQNRNNRSYKNLMRVYMFQYMLLKPPFLSNTSLQLSFLRGAMIYRLFCFTLFLSLSCLMGCEKETNYTSSCLSLLRSCACKERGCQECSGKILTSLQGCDE